MSANSPVCHIELLHADPPNGGGRSLRGRPVTVGVPLPRGYARDGGALGLADEGGRPIARQLEVLQAWSDGSIQWVLLDFQADGPGPCTAYRFGTDIPAVEPQAGIEIREAPDGVTVSTGALAHTFRASTASWLGASRDERTGEEACGPARLAVTIAGRRHDVTVHDVSVERSGALRTTVRLDGSVPVDDSRRLEVTCRLQLHAAQPAVHVACTVRNPHRADHKDGFWELGEKSSILIEALDLHVPVAGGAAAVQAACAVEHGDGLAPVALPVAIRQESSARFTTGHGRMGRRADPCLAVGAAEGSAAVAVAPDGFWQNWPKAITGSRQGIVYSLFPSSDVAHELQGGEQKTHGVWIGLGAGADELIAGLRAPAVPLVSAAWQIASGAVSYLTAPGDDAPELAALMAAALDGPDSFERKRERIDEYGWRNFGDIFADHESTDPQAPFVSHYNNQYDAVAGFACQWLRSGDPRWRTLMLDLARHVVDIDIYHTDEDKPQYNHGLFWHTFHYRDAGRSTHRSYPRAPGVPGGGPSAEHDYSTGLMLAYYQTGEPAFREAVLELAGWVIAMDDGRRTSVGWLDGGRTGWASATAGLEYHGPGRGCGNSIQTLLNGWLLTGDTAYRDKAEELLRRSIHPEEDIARLELLDAERRWSYTVFLQALGRYLDVKAERQEVDAMYAYARASLLHVARWMAAHEYPFMDHPEKLEYPTETWPAQDIRKSVVFDIARLHADDDEERGRFAERADFFFRQSLGTLSTFGTRTLARPLVLMIAYGFTHAWFVRHPSARAARPTVSAPFPPPVAFEAQKFRVLRRLKLAAAASVAVAVLTGVFLLTLLL